MSSAAADGILLAAIPRRCRLPVTAVSSFPKLRLAAVTSDPRALPRGRRAEEVRQARSCPGNFLVRYRHQAGGELIARAQITVQQGLSLVPPSRSSPVEPRGVKPAAERSAMSQRCPRVTPGAEWGKGPNSVGCWPAD